jgi:hypothetical protein
MFHQVCSFGEENAALSLFLEERKKNSGVRERKMVDHLSLTSIQDFPDLIAKVFPANVHVVLFL